MKRHFPIIVLLLLAAITLPSLTAWGQSRGRSWKRGLLTLDQFAQRPFDGQTTSHLGYDISYTMYGSEEGLNSYIYCRTAAVMYPSESWMATGHVTERELEYNQVLFDLVEVHRRQMQRTASLLSKSYQCSLLRRLTLQQLEREIKEIEDATDHGRDSVVLERIRQSNRNWLAENPGTRPDFELLTRWWSISMELAFVVDWGNVLSQMTPSIGAMDIQYVEGWGRHNFHFHFLSGSVEVLPDYVEPDNMNYRTVQRLASGMGYGFTILERPAFDITPYVDFGYSFFVSPYLGYANTEGNTYTLGVKGNYFFHHWHTVTNGAKGQGRRYSLALNGRLYMSYMPQWDMDPVFTIGLHVGFNVIFRRESVSWK